MSVMSPILRIRKVLRSIGANDDQADEFADAMGGYPTKDEFELRLEAMFQRWFNRIVFAVIAITAFGFTIFGVINALID